MTRSFPTTRAIALPLLLVAAACRPSPSSAPSPAPASPAQPAAQAVAAPSMPPMAAAPVASAGRPDSSRHGYSAGDVAFMQHMIGHHGQALTMTALVADRSRSEAVRTLAERITVSQRDEIAMMRRWLEARHESMPMESMDHARHEMADMPGMSHGAAHAGAGDLMPGMLTAEQLARLAAASGADFDRLFLQDMIRHHEGALTMVASLFATPGAAQEPELFRLASDVDADQRAEIARMRALLATMK